jgi:hypothetical protein
VPRKQARHSFSIEDLPHFSPWPARLLGLEPWQPKRKTPAEVIREYEKEKWGPLLARVLRSEKPISPAEIEGWESQGRAPSLCSVATRMQLLTAMEARRRHITWVAHVLRRYAPSPALIELGAGYGAVLFGVARKLRLRHTQMFAGEFTKSGARLLRRLSETFGLPVTVGHCDFAAKPVTNIAVPPGGIVFTSYATHYVPELQRSFVAGIIRLRPRAVIHFEPCYEHCARNTLTGLLRRRYIEVNDYNRNLVTLLHREQSRGQIQIREERPAVFGVNPLLPASLIVWTPAQKRATVSASPRHLSR